MKLYDNWKVILKKSWALRFMALAITSEVAQALLPIYADVIPRELFASLTALSITGAMVSRLVYQEDV